MTLFTMFLEELNSNYKPKNIMMINNKRFILRSNITRNLRNRKDLIYAGRYLGKDKRRFEPSSILLQSFVDEESIRKVSVDRKSAWLFVCGNDLFEEHLRPINSEMLLGENYIVVFDGNCIGYVL